MSKRQFSGMWERAKLARTLLFFGSFRRVLIRHSYLSENLPQLLKKVPLCCTRYTIIYGFGNK